MGLADKAQLEAALAESREIAKRTDLNDEERTDLVKRVELIERMREDIAVQEALRAEEQENLPEDERSPKSLGEALVKSEQYQERLAKGMQTGRVELDGIEFGAKAEPTVIGEATALSGLVVADRINTIEGLGTPLAPGVADLLPVLATDSNAVSYYTEASETETIAPAAEATEKGNFTLTGAAVTDPVEVIAGMAAVTRQALADVSFLRSFIDFRMTRQLKFEEENQILLGNGTPPNLKSIDSRTTSTLSQGTDTVIDALYKAADLAYEATGYPSDAIVIKPSDWQPIALSKDAVDRYYGTGPFASVIGDTLWGMRVVKSRVLSAGKVFVGAFSGGAAFLVRNGGLTIRASDSHADYFKSNKVAILIEERVALAVPAPLAFVDVTLA